MQTGPQEFRNATGLPWVVIIMAKADTVGNYAIDETPQPTVNVVELVCGDRSEEWYQALANRIASFLCWTVVNEHEG